jgi:hypothetical protein
VGGGVQELNPARRPLAGAGAVHVGWLDLRAAELSAPVTTVLAVAYKSRIDILVPPGVRVEMEGFGVSKGWSAEEELEIRLPHDAPTVHVRGVAYKGTIEASTRPPER